MATKTSVFGLSLEQAHTAIEAAGKKAASLGVAENIAIVDGGGNLVAFHRMDGAWIGSIQIAQDKAYTARAFDMTTEALGKMAGTSGPLFGIQEQPRVVIFGGGAPIVQDGVVIGAIGASGGTVPQDIEIMQAGLNALK